MAEISIPQIRKLILLKSWNQGSIGRVLNIYWLFLAWPFISIGNSLSFYIFLLLLLVLKRNGESIAPGFKGFWAWILGAFGAVAIGSTLFSSMNGTFSDVLSATKLSLQVVYWLFLVLFIRKNADKINLYLMCKYLTIGTWIVVGQYFFFNFIGQAPFVISVGRNSMVFTMLALMPFHAYYILKRFGKLGLWLYLPCTVLAMLLSEGRAGVLLIVVQSALVLFSAINRRLNFLAKTVFLISIVSIAAFYNDENRLALAHSLSSLSPRIAAFVEGSGQAGDLNKDESWLTRRLMLRKGMEIIEEYPVFGIGLMNFSNYEAQLSALWEKDFVPLQDERDATNHFNKASSHNSYLQIWCELGYVGLVLFLLLLAPPLIYLLHKIFFGVLSPNELPLISLLFVCVHFYVISTITSALSWFVIGFAYAVFKRR